MTSNLHAGLLLHGQHARGHMADPPNRLKPKTPKAPTPRKSFGSSGTPRAGSAPPQRPQPELTRKESAPSASSAQKTDMQGAVKKVVAGVQVSTALKASVAPQTRGDPNNVKVGVRCRPMSKTELGMGESPIVQFSGTSICLTNPSPKEGETKDNIYAYDFLYDMESESTAVFEEMCKPLVEGLLQGYNGTLFAYGQTGSGKTFSMMGIPEAPGVIPLSAARIFEVRNELLESLGEGATVTVHASYVQIYREVLQDLIGKDVVEELKIRRDPLIGTYVQGLTEHELHSPSGLTKLIDFGNERRATASTLMNATSSRSHAVVIIRIDQEIPARGMKGKQKIASKINLVDLAGSERASKTGATGETLKEAIAINQSLSALGNVINALSDPKAKGHIPYRSSKLTHLLEESLGGNSNTSMLAAISPAGRNFYESLQTLQYATRAKLIVTNAKANTFTEQVKGNVFKMEQMADMQAQMAAEFEEKLSAQQGEMAAQMQAQIDSLMRVAGYGGGGRGASDEELEELRADVADLKSQLAAANAVAQVQEGQLEEYKRRAHEAERLRREAHEAHELARSSAREQFLEELRRMEAKMAEVKSDHARALHASEQELVSRTGELHAATAEKERLAVDRLEAQVAKAQLAEEVRAKGEELHSALVRLASSDERTRSLEQLVEQLRGQIRIIEAQRDQSWAREKLLEEQRAALEADLRKAAEQREAAQKQLQDAVWEQLEAQRKASEKASSADKAEVSGSLVAVQKALARLEEKQAAQAVQVAQTANQRTASQEQELARLDQLLQAQAAAHSNAIAQMERRAASEAERLSTVQRLALEQAEAQLAETNKRLRAAQEDRVRLQSENATRKAAADALGERIATLQEQLSNAQLDAEQMRLTAVAERAESEEAARARQEELEASRLHALQQQHEVEAMRQQLRDRDESLARRAERLRQLQALYERALQDKQRVEEAAWAERQSLHEERRALELRVREEAGRARQAYDAAQRSRNNPGLLERIFNQVASPERPKDGRDAWAEQPGLPIPLADWERMPLPNGAGPPGQKPPSPQQK